MRTKIIILSSIIVLLLFTMVFLTVQNQSKIESSKVKIDLKGGLNGYTSYSPDGNLQVYDSGWKEISLKN